MQNKTFVSVLVIVLSLIASPDFVQAQGESDRAPVHLDFPIVDAPFNVSNGVVAPSMRQSLALSTDFYESLHRAIGGKPGSAWWRRLIVVGADLATSSLPLGSGWLHEEWHRSVMTRRGISSRNDIYKIPIGEDIIAVSHVTDQDLIGLKASHPDEQVRLSSAGMESQTEQNLLFDRHHFFQNSRTFDQAAMVFNAVNVSAYLGTCAGKSADTKTDDMNNEDGADVPRRDFTGLDCNGWVYDLFRPDEPYGERGAHPSGVGVDRYIRYSDLSARERRFLKRQFYFSLFNFADPFLAGFDSFNTQIGSRSLRWNARMTHFLTSFGYTIDANLFLEWNHKKFLVKLHNGFNAQTYFPGLTVEWLDQPLFGTQFLLNHQVTVWQQPKGQRVDARQGSTLLDVSERLSYRFKDYMPYVGVEAKTPGWVAGNTYLDRNLTVWAGVVVSAF